MIKILQKSILLQLILFISLANAQNSKIDSLLNKIGDDINDSVKCEVYYQLLHEMIYDYPSQSLVHARNYLKLAQTVSLTEEIAANNNLGIAYYNLGFLDKTVTHFSESIRLLDGEKDASRMARMLNNLANVYDEMKQYDQALNYYRRSIDMRIKNNDDSTSISANFGNFGIVFMNLNELDSAYKYIKLSFTLDRQMGDSIGLLYSSSTLAEYFLKINEYDSAETYFNNVVAMAKRHESQQHVLCENYNYLGELYLKKGDYQRGLESYKEAKLLAEKMQLGNVLLTSLDGLAKSSKNLGQHTEAFNYLSNYSSLKDSLFTLDIKKQLNTAEINQKEQEIILLTQQGEIDNLNITRSRQLLYFLTGAILLVIIIAIIYYQKHEYKQRTLKIVSKQRNEIAIKNKDIVDSITYAKGIQEAMFPDENELKDLFSESFVFYKPSGVVTGDFYWVSKLNDAIILAVVDCTGHGVPGAFMTVMANSILNSVVNERKITSPSEILKELHLAILNTWHQNEKSALYSNGLDAIICNISLDNMKMTYSGAKRPLYHSREGLLDSYRGNCFSVGVPYYQTEIKCDEHEIQLQKNDYLYLFTDGIIDQFGGPENKKFLGKRLKNLLNEIKDEPLNSQQEQIVMAIEEWMGGTEQVDDMLLIGVKI